MAQIILDSNNNLIQGDFDNVTLNNRTKLQTTTTDATTNVYIVPNGTATSAGVSVANNSDLTNASKIVMATNGTTDTQIISGINGSGTYLPMSFYTNNALAGQFDTSGNLSFGVSNAGIIFNKSGALTNSTLNDYETGNFTPTIIGTSTAGAATYTIRFGSYTKVGNLVFVNIRLGWSAHTGTGNLQISGLPFTSEASAYSTLYYAFHDGLTLPASTVMVGAIVIPSATTADLTSIALSTANTAAIAMDTVVADMNVMGVYRAAS
jgi:hypothetical protein